MIRIRRNTDLISIHNFMLDVIMVIGIGNSRSISTSKIINITTIRKNRDENGSRAEFLKKHKPSVLVFTLQKFLFLTSGSALYVHTVTA
jgi:hypothetical protein